MNLKADYWDIERTEAQVTSIRVKDGQVIEAKHGVEEEVRVRVFNKGAWAYSSSTASEADVKKMLDEASRIALTLSKKCKKYSLPEIKHGKKFLTKYKINPADIDLGKKVKRIFELEKVARGVSNNLSAFINYADTSSCLFLENSEGAEAEQEVVRCGLALNCIAKEQNKIQNMFKSERKTAGYEVVDRLKEDFAKETAERAVKLLSAESPPAGPFVVVLDPILVGTFIHEALGHMAEGDHVANHDSILEKRLGTQIAVKEVNVVDDKTLKQGYGTFGWDRDGCRAERTKVIEKGRLVSLLNSRTSAGKLATSKLKMHSTANCRGEFNAVRMSNTLMLPGGWKKDEMIKDTKSGIYMIGSSGGTAMPISGLFNFAALEGYLIENGKLTKHLRDVSLLGNTLEILNKIDAVGNDLDVHSGLCGKNGEWIPVGSGGPHIRTKAVVGGRA